MDKFWQLFVALVLLFIIALFGWGFIELILWVTSK